ncbi:hypothetical protein GS466_24840 [Rhodococcus hoagii]|nr:hypothetical protein [Prescottella equi]
MQGVSTLSQCSRCGEHKPSADFYPGKRRCKSCILADRKARYATDPDFRERIRSRSRSAAQARSAALLPRHCRRCGQGIRPSRTGSPGLCGVCKHLDGSKIRVSSSDRLAIYERDGWVCQLCGHEVRSDLHPNHALAATLDHIAPRSTTLYADDSPENLRLAHRRCNSARGARESL